MEILVVDDAVEYQKVVREVLGGQYGITSALTLAEAESQLSKKNFDLLLLDVSLPDGNGFDFFAKLQMQDETKNLATIFVTASGETSSEVMGFSLGASDYIIKPVDPLRLRSRVESHLRQIQGRKQKSLVLHKGNIKLNLAQQNAIIVTNSAETRLDLTPMEFKLLFYLLRHEEVVLSRENLLRSVWNSVAGAFDRTVDMHVSKLRKKIGKSCYSIQAVHGAGYRMSRVDIDNRMSHF